MGRGSVVDPSPALSQYFETGGSPRIGISDPQIDKTLAAERVTFDPADRKKALNTAFKAIEDAAPACFMWRHQMLYGEAKNIVHKVDPARPHLRHQDHRQMMVSVSGRRSFPRRS